ncbi:hypothetical protein Pmani_009238 [Petrolisthes manimaculis]|uniref:Uncharacterized protein n=1 Tax=Petrolisthes manimaculis TaxID=1843537 RepID=A0AAE1UGW2_9EUCA|nr:hypothetical protein Pmani_009238 [Petrolisthes manimaculis]
MDGKWGEGVGIKRSHHVLISCLPPRHQLCPCIDVNSVHPNPTYHTNNLTPLTPQTVPTNYTCYNSHPVQSSTSKTATTIDQPPTTTTRQTTRATSYHQGYHKHQQKQTDEGTTLGRLLAVSKARDAGERDRNYLEKYEEIK